MGGHPERLAPHRLQVLLGLLARLGLAARDDNARAGSHVALGECAPDAAGPARHDHYPAGEVEESAELLAVQGAPYL